jgi:Na+/H+ antiporter NhaC
MESTGNRGETAAVYAPSPNGDEATPQTDGTSKLVRQVGSTDAAAPPTETAEQDRDLAPTTSAVVAPTGPKNPVSYDLWVLLPALVAILLAIATRQVVAALVVGIFVGAYMMVPCLAADDPYRSLNSLVAGFRLAMERHIFGAVIDAEGGFAHAKIMVFTLVIGFTIGVIGRNGGTTGMVKLVTGETTSRRRGALTAWFAGLVVFFDDYANTMIVGPTMRSVFDRLKLSRAKLAYIVDSTAAPVASIALIGTWIGAEITFIQHGLDTVAEGGAPLLDSHGNVISGMQAFIYSLPYRFYPILALVLVFLIALTGRDFGPMKRSERKALSKIEPDPVSAEPEETSEAKPPPIWWLGVIPIAVLVAATVGVLIVTGRSAAETAQAVGTVAPDAGGLWAWAKETLWEASAIISKADANLSIFYGAMTSAIVAVLLTIVARACSTRDAVDAGMEGMARMFPAIVILILAWALSAVLQDLRLGEVAGAHLEALEFPAKWLPLAVFLCAAVVSFATGTSWGTLGIICPITVTIAASLTKGLEPGEALTIFYAAVGSVLAGAVFGDHCSPISDTTVLSSIASGCRHEEHVWTQIPYALVAAIAAMGLGDVLCSVLHQPWYFGLGAGVIFLVLVVFIIGRRPVPSFDLAEA